MAGHDISGDAVPIWAQITGGLTFLGVIAAQIWRFLREQAKDDPPSHAVLEAGELADLAPLRDLTKKLGDAFPLIERIDEQIEECLRILRVQERDASVQKEVEDRLRDERMRADREARDRAR